MKLEIIEKIFEKENNVTLNIKGDVVVLDKKTFNSCDVLEDFETGERDKFTYGSYLNNKGRLNPYRWFHISDAQIYVET